MLDLARAFLDRKGLGEARREAEILVGHALGLDRLGLYMNLDRPIQGHEVDAARDLLVRRGRREPTAYIVGIQEFYGRDFRVGAGVLIPRPETELIVDRAREIAAAEPGTIGRIADLGTGSGALAVTLALEIEPEVPVVAVDISEEALGFASSNAEALGANVQCRHGDGVDGLVAAAKDAGAPFDLVVSNPPYVLQSERDDLAPEVRDHEPALALYAPPGAPDHWAETLVARAPEFLRPGGTLLVELGHLQGPSAERLVGSHGAVHPDLAGIPRVMELRLPS